jgi:hypothetical protein
MAEVKLIRMQSGEDVVAEIVKSDDTTTTVKNAIVAIPTGQGQLGFAPWTPILDKTKNEVDVKNTFIVFIADVDNDVANQHKQMYGGVVTAPTKLIV